jgi:hypothetical protein
MGGSIRLAAAIAACGLWWTGAAVQAAEAPQVVASAPSSLKVVWADREEIAIRLVKGVKGAGEAAEIDEFDKVNAQARINQHLAFLRTEAARMLAERLQRQGASTPSDAVITLSYRPEIEARCAAPGCQSIVQITLEMRATSQDKPLWKRSILVASPEVWNLREDRQLTDTEDAQARNSLEEDFVEQVVAAMARDRVL